MPSRPKPSRRSPKKRSTRRGATGARAAARLDARGRKAKAPARKAAKKAVKKAKKAAKPARKATKSASAKKPSKPAKAARKPLAGHPAKPTKRSKPKLPPVEFTETQPPRALHPLRIALFGASGNLGSRIAEEAVRRGHHVTALVRNPQEMTGDHPNLRVVRGDVTDPIQVEVAARNHDVVASAIAPPASEPRVLVEAAQALLSGARATGKRVLAVGGAGSLEAAPGVQLLDTPGFPADWRPVAVAHRDALAVFQGEGGESWTVVSPSALIEPGERTGKFRVGQDQLLRDGGGDSRISMEDFAVAFVDEVESGRNPGRRITVGY